MELKVKDIELIERALLTQLEKFGAANKDFGYLLKDEFKVDWEETGIIHSKFCNLLGNIEKKREYRVKYPDTNQSLNEMIVVQF